ncbi:prolyl oligopeptidase family serine peptidase [Brevibacterium sediminis]|uniref:alpha/beta hydrolase family esterase n=1 Tax=Brevibacterium sediminis TaxID=1857024 RepID=UPI0021751585|nr:PHB depolymerase family esterase [Brevibacterium sediminis]MCS4594025.1 prolyl oligopeptidase family serine peptidase [Brevibacterium sediminis]
MSSTTKRIMTALLATAASAALLTGTVATPGMAATAQTAPAHSAAAHTTSKKASTIPAAPSAGCGTEQKPGNDEKTISTEDGERSYRINIPRDYELETPLPLVLGFHGNGSDGAEFQNYTGLPTLPAITVFPDGDEGDEGDGKRSWQGAPYASGADDVAFVAELLDSVESEHCIDLNRVYATGKSNGGGMVSVLACHLRDRFSAFAPVAGAYYPQSTEGCDYSTPTPMLAIHGTGDATMHYEGGHRQGEDYPGVREWIQPWAEASGCARTKERQVGRKGEDVVRTQWTRCDASVELYTVADGGHVWPGEVVYSGGGYVTKNFSATSTVWDFFRSHPGTTQGPTQK